MIVLDFDGFLKHIQEGFLRPRIPSYKYLDKVKFQKLQNKKSIIGINEAFFSLKERMSEDYYQQVFVAQTQAMQYASIHYPPYSLLLAEDMVDDWLATVDIHKKYARDHSLHQPLTAFIVAELLGYGNSEKSLKLTHGGRLLDYCVRSIVESSDSLYLHSFAKQYGVIKESMPKTMQIEIWKDLFYRTAVISALFHDIGYPWQYVRRVGSALEKCSEPLALTTENAELIVQQFKNRMILLPFCFYQYECMDEPTGFMERLVNLVYRSLKETHGFPGGIAFLSLYDAVRAFPLPDEALMNHFSMEWAAMGIVMHDMKDICKDYPYLRLRIEKDPLSAIVSLADFIEEFNRPITKFTPKKAISTIEYMHACHKVEIESDAHGELQVRMYYSKEDQFVIASVHKAKEAKQYFNPISGFIDLSSFGITGVHFVPVFEPIA